MKTSRLDLSEQELIALAGLIDAGVRATGLRSVKDAVNLIVKIEKALEDGAMQKSEEARRQLADGTMTDRE